jgi:hypothetical protein
VIPKINLNVGGLFGALVVGAAVAAILYLADAPPRLITKLVVLGFIGGSLAGNFLWAYFFPAPTPPNAGTVK